MAAAREVIDRPDLDGFFCGGLLRHYHRCGRMLRTKIEIVRTANFLILFLLSFCGKNLIMNSSSPPYLHPLL